jgi:hypothetical protein
MNDRITSTVRPQPISTEPARPDCSSCGWEIVGEVFAVYHLHADGTVTELPVCKACWCAEHHSV